MAAPANAAREESDGKFYSETDTGDGVVKHVDWPAAFVLGAGYREQDWQQHTFFYI